MMEEPGRVASHCAHVGETARNTSLTATFATTPDELAVDYALSNGGAAGVYVIDVTIAVEAGGVTRVEHRPRVELHPERQLVLVNRITRPDRRRSYAVPPTAYGALLEPGATRTVHVTLPLPLLPANLMPSENVGEIEVEKIALIVAVVPTSAAPNARPLEIGGQPLWQLPTDAAAHQVELRVDGVAPRLRVRVPK
jgi:hypothetical protein